ncbi:uncharacterized protein BCR38DRAFT_435496 [Pseudomassariella vexata]|uniref:Atos-like conserved domain-containing protein n=1 Tax=Pseudomassariella vexata TaxID=1141098 RepID=A0A1Y2DUG8_9PEZI|nr:uncharacterized protein BCR38DRAFT_435496 [Pseudomassariella vexata]ORY62942.1 hypothetical protein BCR38DRAFT_435496 [Pseudomassariella vexata]
MPIFQQDLERRESAEELMMASPSRATPIQHDDPTLVRKLSEESIRTELCEGPLPETPRIQTPYDESPGTCTDRAELIERLKRGESPTWIPNRHYESIWHQHPSSPTRTPKPASNSPSLLEPPVITPEKPDAESDDEKRLQEGLNIERPRSALHSGDFTQDDASGEDGTAQESNLDGSRDELRRPNGHSWLATSPPRDFTPFQFERRHPGSEESEDRRSGLSSLSSSLSQSFIYKPPTSPLVQSESNDDIGLASPMEGVDISSSIPRNTRRHTLVPSYSDFFGFSSPNPVPRQPTTFRQERSFPYQAHQPRRSLGTTPNFSLAGPSPSPQQTPAFLRSRRPSYSLDTSPLQHASMVGSYEESILRGRMSTTPSKPLDFVAQIGVLGLGKCKSSLRCPAHVTLPFPAVFYSYASSSHGRSKDEDGPSPYVGQIDLENGLSNQEEEARSKRKMQSRASERRMAKDDVMDMSDRPAEISDRDARKPQRPKRIPGSPRAPPGGSYRIPERGQIQIIIKNPNKTAVKLFLVPYDLAGMEPGTKTFIRQRSYSAGPIIDNLPELKDAGTADRPILRYLVHLHICSPSRGRYYLYKSIRVVFANRVPDGKERLRNEISLPEPRFTNYKPIRVIHPPTSAGSGPGASLAAEKASRRRSSGYYFGASPQVLADDFVSEPALPQSHFSFNFAGNNDPVEPIPLRIPYKSESSTISSLGGGDGHIDKYDKLRKGDVGYGGNAFSDINNGSPGATEGLLSQRLKSLGVKVGLQQDSQMHEV